MGLARLLNLIDAEQRGGPIPEILQDTPHGPLVER